MRGRQLRAGTCGERYFAERIRVERQRPLCGDTGIKLPQRARRAVARVGHGLVAAFARRFVPGFERGLRHEHLTAHFQHRRRVAAQLQRHAAHRAQVRGDVLAAGAVAAGGTAHEAPGFVAQTDRQAVEFGLGGERRASVAGFLGDAVDEGLYFLVAEGVGQRQHWNRVPHRRELAGRRVADALRGRIRIGQVGMFRFQRFEFAQQAVVLGIRDIRIVEHVVTVVGVVNAATQFLDAGGGACGHPGILMEPVSLAPPRPPVSACMRPPPPLRSTLPPWPQMPMEHEAIAPQHPGDGGRPAGEDVGRVMHAEVDA